MEQAGRRRLALAGEGEGGGDQFGAHVFTAMVGRTAARTAIQSEGQKEPAFGLAHCQPPLVPSASSPVLAAALAEIAQIGAHAQRPVGLAAAREAPRNERAQLRIALAA